MIRINKNYLSLQGSYLFSEIASRVKKYSGENPSAKIIKLGIGDVTRPLTDTVISGLKGAVDDMATSENFHGYGPEQGYEFLREKICEIDFTRKGVDINPDDIFISTGAKEDTANIQELFAGDIKIAITDPVYPVYLDSNIMAGRAGNFANGRFDNIVYLDCSESNNYTPALPSEKVDLIYLCFPNNPTGQVLSKEELAKWVAYAKENKSLILFDAAYEAFIREENVPHSIFEIEGAKEVAVEFRSLSKTAGFTGTRCSYTIVPKELNIFDDEGNSHSLNQLWNRRQSTKFNGVAYIIQKGAFQAFTDEGRAEIDKIVDYYLGNAKIIREGLSALNIGYSGGVNSPYIWFKTPGDYSSWDFFSVLLEQCQVVGTPGVGFGTCGEGYFRLSAFGSRENVEEAVEKISKLKI
ncbi:MAG: LL-diaminopimelate aminotransferase [bacterium]|nr:LL-diaminopimelate aminotransferase [bacterium]MCP4133024.1 LL-diaminopimelate aminotransferase [bacterium]